METLTVGAFVLGMTQLIKDTGLVKGQALKVLAVLIGGVATYVSIYHAGIWDQISILLISLGVTGSVSFVNERR